MKVLVVSASLLISLLGLGLGGYVFYQWSWGSSAHYRAAQKAMQKRDFLAAESHMRICLAASPKDPDTRLLAARIARRSVFPVLPGGVDGPGACLVAGTVHYGDPKARAEEHLAQFHLQGGQTVLLRLEINLLRAQRGEL